ncbi:ABC transporter substrate-binding protein [Salinisphaera sp. RV14]|uniref:ABC transporter substrate-binding protein n=1 Tax=Salinisphaera sp. RV14 TaxID=3454140 RepID=UPI003F82B83A
MKMKKLLAVALTASLGVAAAAPAVAATDITLFRFFGSCNDQYANVTHLDKAVGECGIIQVLTNKFNAEHKGNIAVKTQAVDWGTYYNRLNATFMNRNPPAVAVMHRSHLADYVARHLLTPLNGLFKKVGINTKDFVPAALKSVTFNGKIYALPFDLHAILWHMNTGLLKKAGLVGADGQPRIPNSVDQLMAQAKQFKKATGKPYILLAGSVDPMVTRLFETLVWQQGGHLVDSDLKHADIDSPDAHKALALINTLIDKGYMAAQYNYTDAQQAFLDGKGGVIINGTWVINAYDQQASNKSSALHSYAVATFPTLYSQPAVWADGHCWVMPRGGATGDQRDAAAKLLKYFYDHDLAWSHTGHLPVRESVLKSDAFRDLPHRKAILSTTHEARGIPGATRSQAGIQDALNQQLQATYLTGKSQDAALKAAQKRVDAILSGRH